MRTNSLLTSVAAGLLLVLPTLVPCAKAERPEQPDSRPIMLQERTLSLSMDHHLSAIRVEMERATSLGRPTPELQMAVQSLVQLLPCLPKTRLLQAEACRLHEQFKEAKNSAQAEALNEELQAVLKQIEADPQYASAMRMLDAKLLPSTPSKGNATPKIATVSPLATTISAPFASLQPGDVMLWEDRSGGLLSSIFDFLYARTFTHAAIYLGDQGIGGYPGTRRTYESLNPSLGVQVCNFDGRWTRSGLHIALGHVKNLSFLQRYVVAIHAVNTFGDGGKTPYHLLPPWNKTWLNDGLYCSQLPWVAYAQANVDLDSNDLGYDLWFAIHNFYEPLAFFIARDAVFPDEIRASSDVNWYYDGNNK